MKYTKSVSFIVPAYNEEKNIQPTLYEILKATKEIKLNDFEIIVVNDCSTDKTVEKIIDFQNNYKYLNINLINNIKNFGFGGSFREGLFKSSKNYIMLICGDNESPSESITPMLKRIGDADIILMYQKNIEVRKKFRIFLSKLYTSILNIIFFLNMKYYNGTPIYKKEDIINLKIQSNGFAFYIEILISLMIKKKTYVFVPVNNFDRQNGESSALNIKNLLEICIVILKLQKLKIISFFKQV